MPPALDPPLEDTLSRAGEGGRLSRDDAVRLLHPSVPLAPLLAAAAALRNRGKGRTITYSRKVFIPLTNLCRDRCGYCTFRRNPDDLDAALLSPDRVLATVAAGARAGCTEALFSLGDAPERAFPEARAGLAALGYERTLDYLRAMCAVVLDRSPLFPHANPGLLADADLQALRPVSASLGLMLESVSRRLLRPGGAHHGTRTKDPAMRLGVLEAAGRLRIPFTTGLLVGIGETAEDRVDSLLAIRRLHDRFGHIQEVILQNFKSKPGIPMARAPEPSLDQMCRLTAVARLLLGGDMNLQAPPNLTADYSRLLDAGINDWGGVSPVTRDFINPEAPWPGLAQLREVTEARGFVLRQRLPVYPEYLRGRREFLADELADRLLSAVGADGLVPEAAA